MEITRRYLLKHLLDISHETSKTGSGIQNLVYNFAKKERQEKL